LCGLSLITVWLCKFGKRISALKLLTTGFNFTDILQAVFCTKVFWEAFLYLKFEFAFFLKTYDCSQKDQI